MVSCEGIGYEPMSSVHTGYSLAGQPLSSTTTDSETSTPQSTRWEYDPANPSLVRSVTESSGLRVSYTYDDANRVATAGRSTGASESWQYDGFGRVWSDTVSAPDAAPQVTLFKYNRFDQPVFLTLPGHTAQKPRTETRTYDAKGRLRTQSGPGTYALTYDYDGSGNMSLMVDANGSETRWVYDARNRLSEKHYPGGKTWLFTHDAAGHLETRKDALNRTTKYLYNNAFGRISDIDYPNDPDVHFAYDSAGRLTGMGDSTGNSTWTPDAWNRTASGTQPLTGRSLSYTYNARGQRQSLAFTGASLPVRTVSYQYDSLSRLSSLADSVTGGAFVYSYQPGTNWVSQVQTPSGSATVTARDSLGRITDTAFLKVGDNVLNSFTYTYDAAGQRSTEKSQRGDINFAYNGVGELTGADGFTGGSYSYSYDGIGNRLSASAPDAATGYTPDALNQYADITRSGITVNPAYDDNGNLTGDGAGSTFSYDEENRLVAIVKGTKRSEFVYDGLGRRVETRELENGNPVKTIRYVYDGLLPVEEFEWTGAVSGDPARVRQITRGPDFSGRFQGAGGIGGLLAFTTDGTSAWYFSDANGNVANLFTPADTAAATYTYDPFGRRLTASGALAGANTFQWSGKEFHEPSGMVYYLHRFYDPQNGRWLNRDPLGEEGGVNLYGFVFNNPIRLLDAWGLSSFNEYGFERSSTYEQVATEITNQRFYNFDPSYVDLSQDEASGRERIAAEVQKADILNRMSTGSPEMQFEAGTELVSMYVDKEKNYEVYSYYMEKLARGEGMEVWANFERRGYFENPDRVFLDVAMFAVPVPKVGMFCEFEMLAEQGVQKGVREAATVVELPNKFVPLKAAKGAGRDAIISRLNQVVDPAVIKNLDANAMVGYRGSLASGVKYEGGLPFNSSNFDVDAFIVSDKLAAQVGNRSFFRSADRIPILREAQSNIDTTLRLYPEFQGMRNDPFTFRIFTTKEWQTKYGKSAFNLLGD